MGDFVIRSASIDSISGIVGAWAYQTAFPPGTQVSDNNASDLLLAANYTGSDGAKVAVANRTFTHFSTNRLRGNFNQFDDIISLDGNPAISFNSLPSGFTPTSALLIIQFAPNNWNTSSVGRTAKLQLDIATELDITATVNFYAASPTTIHTVGMAYDFTPPDEPTMLDIINNGWGVEVLSGSLGSSLTINNISIVGTYTIVGFMFSLDTPSPILTGQQVDISSDGGLLGVTQLILQSGSDIITLTPSDFFNWTDFTLSFTMPVITGAVSFSIIGTSFSGTVSLGVSVVLIENGSGIYRIIPGKTNDTLYVNSGIDDSTTDVKIPDPYAKGGFVGG